MASIPNSPDVERIDINGAEATQCLQLIRKLQLDQEYNCNNWNVEEIYKINKNKALRQSYEQRKSQLGPNAREIFAFACAGKDKVISIARDGVVIKSSRHAVGDTNQGINLCRYSDVQLKAAASCNYMRVNLLVFKVAYCKQKKVEATEGNAIQPDPDYDCHVSLNLPTSGEPIGDQLRKSQIYLYEHGENGATVRRPRQVFPLVVIHFLRKCKPAAVRVPVTSSGPVVKIRMPVNASGAANSNQAIAQFQIPSRIPLTIPLVSSPQSNINTGSSPICYQMVQLPAGSNPQSPSLVNRNRQATLLRKILPVSSSSGNSLISNVGHPVVSQAMPGRGLSQSSNSGILPSPFGRLPVTRGVLSGQVRPVATQLQIMNASTGQIFQVRMPANSNISNPMPQVYHSPVNNSSINFQPPPTPSNWMPSIVKIEERRPGRPVNDNIDLTDGEIDETNGEIDETNVIEIAPIEEPDEEDTVETVAASNNDYNLQTLVDRACADLIGTSASRYNNEFIPATETIQRSLPTRAEEQIGVSLPNLSVEAASVPVTSVTVNNIINTVSASDGALSKTVATSIATDTGPCTTVTVAKSTDEAAPSTSAIIISDHIDLTTDLDDVVDELLVLGRQSSTETSTCNNETSSHAQQLKESPSKKTEYLKEIISEIGSKLQSGSLSINNTSSLSASDVILLDSDDDENEMTVDLAVGENTNDMPLLDSATINEEPYNSANLQPEPSTGVNCDGTISSTEKECTNKKTLSDDEPQNYTSPGISVDNQVEDNAENSTENDLTIPRAGSRCQSELGELLENNAEKAAKNPVLDLEACEANQEFELEVSPSSSPAELVANLNIARAPRSPVHDPEASESIQESELEESPSSPVPELVVTSPKSPVHDPQASDSIVETELEVPSSDLAPGSIARAATSPIHDPEVSEQSQESEQCADDYDETQVFRVKASERRSHETIFEGTVFKIGEDGSVELVIERYFIRNRAKFVLSDDEDEEQEEQDIANSRQQNDKSGCKVPDSLHEPEEPIGNTAEKKTEEPEETIPVPDSSACQKTKSKQLIDSFESSSCSSSNPVAKKKNRSKCPFVRGVKRKKKQSKTIPSKVMAIEGSLEPMPEPEKKRLHGRRMPVDIQKLREEALAKAAEDDELIQRSDDRRISADVESAHEPPSDDHESDMESSHAPTVDDQASADIETSHPLTQVGPGIQAAEEDDGSLHLKVVDVRSEVEVPDIPVKVEIDTATEDITYCDTTDIEYLNVPSPGSLSVQCSDQIYTIPDIKQSPNLTFTFPTVAVVKTEDTEQYMKEIYTNKKFQPFLLLKNLTSQQIKKITDDLKAASDGGNSPDVNARARSDIGINKADGDIQDSLKAHCISSADESGDVKMGVVQEQVKSEAENVQLKDEPGVIVSPKKEQKRLSGPVTLLEENVLSEDEFINETPRKTLYGRKRKHMIKSSSDDDHEMAMKGTKPEQQQVKRKKKTKSVQFLDSDDDSDANGATTKTHSDSSNHSTEKKVDVTESAKAGISSRRVSAGVENRKEAKSQKWASVEKNIALSCDNEANEIVSHKISKKKKKVNCLLSSDSESVPDTSRTKSRKMTKKPNEVTKEKEDGAKVKEENLHLSETTDTETYEMVVRRKISKKKKVNRLLSSDSDSMQYTSNAETEKKTKKFIKKRREKPNVKEESENSSCKQELPAKDFLTPKKKLILKPGAVIPLTNKSRGRASIELLSSPTTPDFSDTESEVDYSKLSVSAKRKGHTSVPSSSGSGKKRNLTEKKADGHATSSLEKRPQLPEKKKSDTPEVASSTFEKKPYMLDRKVEPSNASSSVHERKPSVSNEATSSSTDTKTVVSVPGTPAKTPPNVAKTPKKLPKPASKLEQFRQKMATNQPELAVFKPQKKQQPTESDHIKNTAERYRRLSDSEKAEENKRKAIELYKKNTIKSGASEKKDAKPKKIVPAESISKRAFHHDSDKINNFLQDMMKSEQTLKPSKNLSKNGKDEKKDRLSVDTNQTDENNISKGNKKQREECSPLHQQETDIETAASPSGDLGASLDDDIETSVSMPVDETTQASEDSQNIDDLYAEKQQLIMELAEEPGNTKFYTDSEQMKSFLKAKSKGKVINSEKIELFNGYISNEAGPPSDESQIKPEKWMAALKKMNFSKVNVPDKIVENCQDVMKTVRQNEASAVPSSQATSTKSVHNSNPKSLCSKPNRPKKTKKVLLATSEGLKQIMPHLSSSSSGSIPSANHSNKSSTFHSGVCQSTLPDWFYQTIPCHRRKPPIFRPRVHADLLKYYEGENVQVQQSITLVLGRIKELKKRLRSNEKSGISDSEENATVKDVLKQYEREMEKLTIDQEIIEKDLAACKQDPEVQQFSRLPNDVLLQNEISESVTSHGTPIYTLHAIDKKVYLEMQTFNLDIGMTRREIDLKPEKDRLASLRKQLKWLYEKREDQLKHLCTCDAKCWTKHQKDLSGKIDFYSGILQKLSKSDSDNTERIPYLESRIETCRALITYQKAFQDKQKVRAEMQKLKISNLKEISGAHAEYVLRSPENLSSISSPQNGQQTSHPVLNEEAHWNGALTGQDQKYSNLGRRDSCLTDTQHWKLIPVEKSSCNYEESKDVLLSLYPDGKLDFTKTVSCRDSSILTYTVTCEDIHCDPRIFPSVQENSEKQFTEDAGADTTGITSPNSNSFAKDCGTNHSKRSPSAAPSLPEGSIGVDNGADSKDETAEQTQAANRFEQPKVPITGSDNALTIYMKAVNNMKAKGLLFKTDDVTSPSTFHQHIVSGTVAGQQIVRKTNSGQQKGNEAVAGPHISSETSCGQQETRETSSGQKKARTTCSDQKKVSKDSSAGQQKAKESSSGQQKATETSLSQKKASKDSSGPHNISEIDAGPQKGKETNDGQQKARETSSSQKKASKDSSGPHNSSEIGAGLLKTKETNDGQQIANETSSDQQKTSETSSGQHISSETSSCQQETNETSSGQQKSRETSSDQKKASKDSSGPHNSSEVGAGQQKAKETNVVQQKARETSSGQNKASEMGSSQEKAGEMVVRQQRAIETGAGKEEDIEPGAVHDRSDKTVQNELNSASEKICVSDKNTMKDKEMRVAPVKELQQGSLQASWKKQPSPSKSSSEVKNQNTGTEISKSPLTEPSLGVQTESSKKSVVKESSLCESSKEADKGSADKENSSAVVATHSSNRNTLAASDKDPSQVEIPSAAGSALAKHVEKDMPKATKCDSKDAVKLNAVKPKMNSSAVNQSKLPETSKSSAKGYRGGKRSRYSRSPPKKASRWEATSTRRSSSQGRREYERPHGRETRDMRDARYQNGADNYYDEDHCEQSYEPFDFGQAQASYDDVNYRQRYIYYRRADRRWNPNSQTCADYGRTYEHSRLESGQHVDGYDSFSRASPWPRDRYSENHQYFQRDREYPRMDDQVYYRQRQYSGRRGRF